MVKIVMGELNRNSHSPTQPHAPAHTQTHTEGQTAFVSVMQSSEQQREALLEKWAVVFSSPKITRAH